MDRVFGDYPGIDYLSFDLVVDNPGYQFKLPGPPTVPVGVTDHRLAVPGGPGEAREAGG